MNTTDDPSDDRFHRLCRQHGLRITPQRKAIYDALCRSGEHPTAEGVHALINKRYPNISLDTVNRTLLTFAEIGLADIVEGFGSPRRYDPNLEAHHHVHCIKCGAIMDFRNDRYDELDIPPEINRKFKIVSKKVVLNGICSHCRQGGE